MRLVIALIAALGVASCFPEVDPNANSEPDTTPSSGGSSSKPTKSRGKGGTSPTTPDDAGAPPTVSEGGTGATEYLPEPEPGGAPSPPEPVPPGKCLTVHTSMPLPAREEALDDSAADSGSTLVFVRDIIAEFALHCGSCHMGEANSGGFNVSNGDFPTKVTAKVISDYVQSSDPEKSMPQGPEKKLYSARGESDPIVRLVGMLDVWLDAGSPDYTQVIHLPRSPSEGGGSYLLPRELGLANTNLGTCVPESDFPIAWGAEYRKRMKELDDKFATMAKVPVTGGENVPLASQLGLPEHLSETDLITFDTEELARYGIVAFAPTYPLWSDNSGKLRYVRVPLGQSIRFDKERQEFTIPPNTRFYKTFLKEVIGSTGEKRFRKIETRLIVSRPNLDSGEPTALFGSYAWNDDETDAVLVTDPLRDGEAYRDRLITYFTDEPAAAEILAKDPPPRNPSLALQTAKAIRHYAIPGRDRCVDCHRGSVRNDFVLGFTPMQIWRRKVGEGGVLEPASGDELTQLERLIGLGVITGIDSSGDILPLEESQGERKPRNKYELTAQGYMFGNCGHCHNPGGYATLTVPALKDLLRFWPNKDGGIFEFPLERVSPRITRSPEGRQMPYITPSLRDLLPYNYDVAVTNGSYKVKFDVTQADDNGNPLFFDAPWRSLIYRNTETPFTYADDFAIFPHMPLDTAGYDCRASQILGTWMVSIPATLKHPELSQDFIDSVGYNASPGSPEVENEPQPYVELKPTDRNFGKAQLDANVRIATFQKGVTYTHCPDGSDIVDPDIEAGINQTFVPQDVNYPTDGVPEHAHWVVTDLTEPPSDYYLRGGAWKDVFDGKFPNPGSDATAIAKQDAEKKVVELLQNITLDSTFLDFAKKPFPLGLWKTKTECDFSKGGVRRAKDYTGSDRYLWLDQVGADDFVFEKPPGGAIYDMICTNCHGPNFDSKGRQAETVMTLSGGTARVANFRTGLFGPESDRGKNRADVFEEVVTSALTADDWGARYMSWMALGGTKALIPKPVLQLVSLTDVAGTPRTRPLLNPESVSANMLAAAEAACAWFMRSGSADLTSWKTIFGLKWDSGSLIQTNGDGELWQRVCTLNNAPPIARVDITGTGSPYFYLFRLDPTLYPPNQPVGNHRGELASSLAADNYFPWCIGKGAPGDPVVARFLEANKTKDGKPLPVCPDAVNDATWDNERMQQWSRRGAINAGLSVFVYLDRVLRGQTSPYHYDQCELLK